MSNMGDDREKTCPLCAEEMDLTDQQLKPCKCGYEICVWCWHHIIEMAEKEDSEGRCPACRTRYDKERIVGMAASCKRMVSELNAEKKQKFQRAKPKTSLDARKHLDGVRVIKQNLVYIIGLPTNLANESILERKEYFGQYGKVLKVSISRPANITAANHQAANNNTFSVYITYAREEEAIRCIQAVHNFVLDGKPLRACFGTTKYCHLWLRNTTCSNPDCLYLHDVGSQDDSFTKDEIISAYSRSKVPQSASNNLQRRVGHVLPPADDMCDNGAVFVNHALKGATNSTSVQDGCYANVIIDGKSPVLPAAASWGSCVSSCRPSAASMASSQNCVKHKVDLLNSPSCLSSIVANTKQSSAWHDDAVIPSKMAEERYTVHANSRSRLIEAIKPSISRDSQTTASDVSAETLLDAVRASKISAWDDDITAFKIPEGMHAEDSSRTVETLRSGIDDVCRSAWDDDEVIISQIPEGMETIHMNAITSSSDTMKPHINRDFRTSVSDISPKIAKDASHSTGTSLGGSSSPFSPLTGPKDGGISSLRDNTSVVNCVCPEDSEKRSRSSIPDKVCNGLMDEEKTETMCSELASVNINGHLGVDHPNMNQIQNSVPTELDKRPSSYRANGGSLSNAQKVTLSNSDAKKEAEDLRSDDVLNFSKTVSCDMRESSTIRDILSLDFDPWDDSSSSANNFSKPLDKQDVSSISSLMKLQNSNQSRFSFARQENQSDSFDSYARRTADNHKLYSSSEDPYTSGSHHISQNNSFDGSIALLNNNSAVSSDITAGVARGRLSTPPGFSVPNRAPPPGFSPHDRHGLSYETSSENRSLGHSSLRSHYPVHSAANASDVEFIDPAILAVGKGILPLGVNNSGLSSRYTFPTHFSSSDNDPRLHLLKQQSFAAHQDPRISEHVGDRFLPSNDPSISYRLQAQNHRQSLFAQIPQPPRASHILGSQLDGWNDMPTVNDMRMAERLRNERLGLNSYFPVNEENRFHRASSDDIYNRAFGM